MRRLLLTSLVALTAASCSGDGSAAQVEPERTLHQLILVYDRSTSITDEALGVYHQFTARAPPGGRSAFPRGSSTAGPCRGTR